MNKENEIKIKCDNCNVLFWKKKCRINRSKLHFCNRKCADENKTYSMTGDKNHRFGKKNDEEWKLQRSKEMIEIWKNDSYRNKVKKSILEARNSVDSHFGWDENSIKKRKETMLNKFGVEHNWSSSENRKKCEKTCLELYGKNSLEIAQEYITKDIIEKRRRTLIKTMTGLSYEEYEDTLLKKEKYYKEVRRITEQQPIHLLEHYEKRASANFEGAYHLDHIIPIFYGLIKGISPEIMGGIKNLRFIPAIENIRKSCTYEEI